MGPVLTTTLWMAGCAGGHSGTSATTPDSGWQRAEWTQSGFFDFDRGLFTSGLEPSPAPDGADVHVSFGEESGIRAVAVSGAALLDSSTEPPHLVLVEGRRYQIRTGQHRLVEFELPQLLPWGEGEKRYSVVIAYRPLGSADTTSNTRRR